MDLHPEGNEEKKSGLLKGAWRERLQEQLSTQEMQFLRGVFAKTSLRFFCFGVCVFGLNAIAERFVPGVSLLLFYACLILLVFATLIPAFFMRRRWFLNPLAVSPGFRQSVLALTYFTFITLFLLLIHVYQTYVHDASSGVSKEVGGAILTAGCFGIAWLIYLIPVFVAWFCMTRKQAIKLNNFIIRCFLCFLPIALVNALLIFTGVGGVFSAFLYLICMLVFSILALLCPFVTLFRFKAVAHTIDYTNEQETKAWEDFFGFVMLEQMLMLALRIMQIALRVMASRR